MEASSDLTTWLQAIVLELVEALYCCYRPSQRKMVADEAQNITDTAETTM
jgi:hypothetical protein